MSQPLTISAELYSRLEEKAPAKSIEELLEKAHLGTREISEEELQRREELGRQTDALRERIFDQCGVLPNSVPLIREDRER